MRSLCAAAVVLLVCSFAQAFDACRWASEPADWPVFSDFLMPMQFSSHDRLGFNSDGFLGLWSHLGRDGQGRQILFDERGPGVITRIWTTSADLSWLGRLQFFFDDEPTPRIDAMWDGLFGCQLEPFVEPFCFDAAKSSGGWVLLYPIPFRKRLVIKATGKAFFWQVSWQRLPYGEDVESFTGNEDCSALAELVDPGRAPAPLVEADYEDGGTLALGPGEIGVVAEGDGPGMVVWLSFELSGLSKELLDGIVLVMEFDGREASATSVPLLAAFGYATPEVEVITPGWGMVDGEGYLAYPMPFWRGFRIALHNRTDSAVEIPWRIGLSGQVPPASRAGRFRIVETITDPTRYLTDAAVLTVSGRGSLMGVALDMTGSGATRGYLEGDEHIHVDGMAAPVMVGTGTEDFFGGGWYFIQGPFSLPTHGNPVHEVVDGRDRTVCYRNFFPLPLSFRDGIRFTIEHDLYNLVPNDSYRAVAYLYHADAPSLAWREVCRLDDAASVRRCGYEFGTGSVRRVTGVFEDEDLLSARSYAGYKVWDYSRIALPSAGGESGVWLLRTTVADPTNLAFFTGGFEGAWYDPWWNPFKRLHQQARMVLADAIGDATEAIWISTGEPFVDLELQTAALRLPNLDNIASIETTVESITLRVGECTEFSGLVATYIDGQSEDVSLWAEYVPADERYLRTDHNRICALTLPAETSVAIAIGDAGPIVVPVTIEPESPAEPGEPEELSGCGC